jgi:ribosome-associated protein
MHAEASELANALAQILHEKQATDITILDVSGPLVIADAFVIATARNPRHANALGNEVSGVMKAKGLLRRNAAGTDSENLWVLVDFDTVVVHVFETEARKFYDLEGLWADAPRVPFTPVETPVAPVSADGLEPLEDLPPVDDATADSIVDR